MCGPIQDGTGSNIYAKVDSENKLRVGSVSEPEFVHASELGDTYSVGSGPLNLTDSTESAILYFKNQESRDVFIKTLNITWLASNGGTNGFSIQIYRNVLESSEIVTDGNIGRSSSFNLGSTKELQAQIYKGGQGKLINGVPGELAYFDSTKSDTRILDIEGFIVGRGQNVGISVTPSTGNSSFTVGIGLNLYMKLLGTS